MSPFRLARLDLARHRAATVLAAATLALLVAAMGILLRTWKLAESRFATLAISGHALVGAKADPIEMTLSALNLEGGYPEFIPMRFAVLLNDNWLDKDFRAHITPLVFSGTYRGRRVIGTSRAFLGQPSPSPRVVLASGAWPDTGAGVVVGAETARREKLKPGDSVRVTPWIPKSETSLEARNLPVVGVLEPMGNAWDGALFTNLIQAQILMGRLDPAGWNGDWSPLVLHYLLLHLPPGGMEPARTVINQRTVAQVTSIPEALNSLERLTATGRALGRAAMALALCLAATAGAALLLGRFDGLKRQLATLEAIGFSKGSLLRMLAWEGALLGLIASGAGAALDALLFPMFRNLLAGTLPGPAVSSVFESWPVWSAVVPLTMIAAMLPALLVFRGAAGARLRGLA